MLFARCLRAVCALFAICIAKSHAEQQDGLSDAENEG
jgi:hypothetical protein